jgi:hypothetical protein
MIEFTQHPVLQAPSDEEIIALGELDPKLLRNLHEAHEGRIRAAEEDPLTTWVRFGGMVQDAKRPQQIR